MRHDLRCGLLRRRYLAVPVFTAAYCWTCLRILGQTGESGAWIDHLIYMFAGKAPLDYSVSYSQLELPVLWLLAMGICLFLNLDYFLQDLSLSGQQVLVRCGSRRKWFLAKAAWNLCSSVVYFLLIGATALAFALVSGGEVSCQVSPAFAQRVLLRFDPVELSGWEAFLAGCLLPFLSVAALNMLEMTLCLFVHPAVSFLACIAVLVLSVYWNSPFALGNGAMVMRSALVAPDGIDPWVAALVAAAVILISVIAGVLRFQSADILNMEE